MAAKDLNSHQLATLACWLADAGRTPTGPWGMIAARGDEPSPKDAASVLEAYVVAARTPSRDVLASLEKRVATCRKGVGGAALVSLLSACS